MQEIEIQPFTPARNGSLVLMLSLFLIMLVFFVLLNAISRPVETKQAAAIYGVQAGFDSRSNAGKIGDDFTEQMGPAWFAPMEGNVSGLVNKAWPGADMTMDVASGRIEIALGLDDAWKDGAFEALFVAMVENLRAILKETPEAGLYLVAESPERDDVAAMFAAATEQLEGIGFGWQQTEAKTAEGRVGLVKIIIANALAVPAEAAAKAETMLKTTGATVKRSGHE